MSFYDSEFYCHQMGMCADGKILVGKFGTKGLKVYDVQSAREIEQVNGDANIKDLSITANAETVMATSMDNMLHILDFSTSKRLGSIDRERFAFRGEYLNQDRQIIAGMDYEHRRGLIQVWELSTGKVMWTFKFPYVCCISLSWDAKFLVAGNSDYKGGLIKIWDLNNGEEIFSQRVYDYIPREYSPYSETNADQCHGVNGIMISPDNSTIIYKVDKYGTSPQGIAILSLTGQTNHPKLLGVNSLGDFSADSPWFITPEGQVIRYELTEPSKNKRPQRFVVRNVPVSENGQMIGYQMSDMVSRHIWIEVKDLTTGKSKVMGEPHKW